MFSTISSYIWGGEAEAGLDQQQPEAEPQATAIAATVVSRPTTAAKSSRRKVHQHAKRDHSPQNGDDWVLIGDDPSPGNLSGDALDPLPPVSETSSVNGEQVETSSTRVPATRPELQVAQTQKCLRQAQLTKQRNTNKALSSKALKRSNKAVTCTRKESYTKFTLPIKSAGFNKNLKQC